MGQQDDDRMAHYLHHYCQNYYIFPGVCNIRGEMALTKNSATLKHHQGYFDILTLP
jgi:hypothetical protein